jgi:hypothetical protein
MEWTVRRFIEARDTVDALLRALPLQDYLFEVEPKQEHWEVRLEYPTPDAWRMITLTVDDATLSAVQRDAGARDEVLDRWKQRVGRPNR